MSCEKKNQNEKLECSRVQCRGTGIWTNRSLGPTRARLDVRKRNFLWSKNQKLQALNSAKQELENVHDEIAESFRRLQEQLKSHPKHSVLHVQ